MRPMMTMSARNSTESLMGGGSGATYGGARNLGRGEARPTLDPAWFRLCQLEEKLNQYIHPALRRYHGDFELFSVFSGLRKRKKHKWGKCNITASN